MSLLSFGFTAEQILREQRVTRADIDLIKAWLDTQNHPKLTDEQIIIFLLSCNNDQEATQRTICARYRIIRTAPNVFSNWNVHREDLSQQLSVVQTCIAPQRTNDGSVVLIHRLIDSTASHYHMEQASVLLLMTIEAAIYDYPPFGLIVLVDMQCVSFMHLTRVNLDVMQLLLSYEQEALPVQLKAVHAFNTVSFLENILFLVKPFVKKDLITRVHFHYSDINMELFYQNHVPKQCLPSDYGGELPSVNELNRQNIEKLVQMQQYFEAEEQQRKDLIIV